MEAMTGQQCNVNLRPATVAAYLPVIRSRAQCISSNACTLYSGMKGDSGKMGLASNRF